jgi:23S rRNA pseudouridine1911/1915/1917 synthase
VLETFGQTASLLACRLETGRTHQIRIHFAETGHPVVGDPVYGPRNASAFPVAFQRQALHACALAFTHPFSGKRIQAEASLPADLEALIERLRRF